MKSNYDILTAFSVTYNDAEEFFDGSDDNAVLSLSDNRSYLTFKSLSVDLAYKLLASKYVRFAQRARGGLWE